MGEALMLAAAGAIVLRGVWKRVDVYAAFVRGARRGMEAAVGLLPALCAMMAMIGLMNASGLTGMLSRALSPVMALMNLPQETASLLLLRPVSGSGSTALLRQIFLECGVDSRAGRAASVLMGASETIFYTMTVYLGATGVRRLPWVMTVSLLSYLAGAVVCGIII